MSKFFGEIGDSYENFKVDILPRALVVGVCQEGYAGKPTTSVVGVCQNKISK